MSGGGGGGGPAPQDNSMQLAVMNAQKAKDDEETQRRLDQIKRDEFTAGGKSLSFARQAAADRARQLVTSRGLNYDDYAGDINSALDTAGNRIPDLDPNPSQYFSDDVINNALSGVENNRRSMATNRVNQTFTPGFETANFADTLDDPYINELLSGQKADATRSLDFAKERGQLTDLGYSGATGKLGEQETGARSTLDSLGAGVLAKDRANLTAVKDRATSGANSYSLGGPDFDITPYLTDLNSAISTGQTNLKGDITNALGGTKLFNVNDILLAGAGAQGPQNLTTTGGGGTVPKKPLTTDRGLGSGGQF